MQLWTRQYEYIREEQLNNKDRVGQMLLPGQTPTI